MKLSGLVAMLLTCASLAGAGDNMLRLYSVEQREYVMSERVNKDDAEWKKQLTPLQFDVTRKKGTERAFTGDIPIRATSASSG